MYPGGTVGGPDGCCGSGAGGEMALNAVGRRVARFEVYKMPKRTCQRTTQNYTMYG